MTKVVVRLQSPDVPEGSFAAQPKTMYRAGTRYCRIEEMPDSERGIHGLVVINEPDAWLINLVTKTAQYQADPGPTFNCRLPVFADDVKSTTDAGGQIKGLEFGRELTYFQGRGATSRPGPILQGESTKAYTVEIGDSQLLLFTTGTPEKPVALARQHGNKRDAYWYGTYEVIPSCPLLLAIRGDLHQTKEAKQQHHKQPNHCGRSHHDVLPGDLCSQCRSRELLATKPCENGRYRNCYACSDESE
jgi:hypothetical protein